MRKRKEKKRKKAIQFVGTLQRESENALLELGVFTLARCVGKTFATTQVSRISSIFLADYEARVSSHRSKPAQKATATTHHEAEIGTKRQMRKSESQLKSNI